VSSRASIGEESVAAGEKEELTDEYTWIVDPIDVRSLLIMVCEEELTSRAQ
jgi:hypothetical protein